jgi:hypothetical protein
MEGEVISFQYPAGVSAGFLAEGPGSVNEVSPNLDVDV